MYANGAFFCRKSMTGNLFARHLSYPRGAKEVFWGQPRSGIDFQLLFADPIFTPRQPFCRGGIF